MAFNVSSSSKRNGSKKRLELMSEINITPVVDVLLVLLVVFMVSSPMLVAGINVDLPETKAGPISADQTEPLVISMDKKGDIYIFETKIERKELTNKLKAITKEKKDTRIFVRGDKNVSYGEVVNLMGEIHNAGFTKVALISSIKRDDKK
jgi:biopolymer transport protein TolR